MSNTNSSGNRASLHPLVLAMVLAGGILLGYLIRKNTVSKASIFAPQSFDKIDGVLDYIENYYVDTVNTNKLEQTAIAKLLENLDPHSIYIPAEETQGIEEDMQGNFEGIGIQFLIKKDTIFIESVIQDGPSEKAGILAGDKIVYVNDSLIAGKGITNNDVMKLLKGPKGTKVKIKVKRDNRYESFTITRDKIPVYSVDVAYMMNKEVGYLKINRFSATTYEEFISNMEMLKKQGMTKLVLDLRNNPGGYLQAAFEICDEFLAGKKMVVYTEGAHQKKQDYVANRKGVFEEGELVVLINENSASASEILSGAMQDWDRGTIIGRRSFGKGLVQEQFAFPDNSALRLTIAKYYTPSGRSIQKSYENIEDYYNEVNVRYEDGELLGVDTTNAHQDTTVYYTLIEKRKVYGGGGIAPDIFIPLDTASINLYVAVIRSYANEYAIEYVKTHPNIAKEYNENSFAKAFTISDAALSNYYSFAKSKGYSNVIIKNSSYEKAIKYYIKAAIAKQVFKNAGYYKALNADDKMIDAALKSLK